MGGYVERVTRLRVWCIGWLCREGDTVNGVLVLHHHPEDGQAAGRNMLLRFLLIKYIINTEVHLLAICIFCIRLLHGRRDILIPLQFD